MPVYEYRCQDCGEVSGFLEKMEGAYWFWEKWFLNRRCAKCKSKKLTRILSSCSVVKTQTRAEMFNDLSKMAPINFVPKYPEPSLPPPPPGGCPNCGAGADASKTEAPARETIKA